MVSGTGHSVVRRLFVLDGGFVNVHGDGLLPSLGPDRIDSPVPMWLIDTELGWVLVDTGSDPGVIDDPVGTWGESLARNVVPKMEERHRPERQLELLGLGLDDISLVVYTHLHHDHAGSARFFPDVKQVVQRKELRFAMAPDTYTEEIYLHSDFDHPQIQWLELEGDTVLAPGLQVIHTPGHTPGHQSIVLWDVPELGNVILAGDAIYMRDNVRRDEPAKIATGPAEAMASMHRLAALAEATDAMLLPGHDPELWKTLPKAPEELRRLPDSERVFWDVGPRRERTAGAIWPTATTERIPA